jgi:hypothetical protein
VTEDYQPTMFEEPAKPRARQPELVKCGAVGVGYTTSGKHPRCNRPSGHAGKHQIIDRRTFGIVLSW